MNNCYCGHPKERHGASEPGPIPRLDFKPCDHCCCKDYAESQEPKALEEYGDTWCACSMFGEVHKKSSHDKAKPQEEPKGEILPYSQCQHPDGKGHTGPCQKEKETEPNEEIERDMDLDRCKNKECIGYKNGYADGAMIEKEQNALKNSSAIILQRPKGWRIGQTIWNFKEWLRLTHEVKDFFYMTDDEWNRRWNEYLTSIKSQE